MFADSPVRMAILILAILAAIVILFRRTRPGGTAAGTTKPRRRAGGVGTGAMGAVYGMLNEDQRRAIEVLVEHKAAAVDPERQRDNPPARGTDDAALRRASPERHARIATPADVGEIVRVTNLAYRVEDFFIDGDRTNAADVADKMAATGACFLVVDVPSGNGLAASVYVELRGERAYFGMLSVAPAHQKRGLSRVLIDAVDSHARAAGCKVLEIDVVNVREELPAFYARMGFRVIGTAPFMKGHTLKRAVHMILMERSIR
ncbi:MAG: GNAT family N-acetyltransferase [Acidobacteria bacterium]|nr:MAG: GNAT family N-acetyltransferase [Acidobacteriota bacterium]